MKQSVPLMTRCVHMVCAAVALGTAFASPARAYDPLAGDYSKENPLDIRVMEYNHQGNFISDPSADAEFGRILQAINPDVICFEEFSSSISANTIASRLNALLPIAGGGVWQIHLGISAGTRNVIASRYPLTLKRTDTIPASSTRGVTIALMDLPDALYDTDVYLMGVHLKCCGNPGGSEDASRQLSADAIANWLGDARGAARPSGDNVVLPAETPIFVLGDFNLVGGPQPGNTIVTGDIQNTSIYGPDVKGDWDSTDITDLLPVDPFTGSAVTWQGNSEFAPSTLDHMFFTDSAVTIAHSFVFRTDTMSASARAAAGVQAGDTLEANSSDHLPIVADLRLVGCQSDGECDDGVFCNGAETCAGSAGCAPGAAPCAAGAWCDEDADACVPLGDGDFDVDGDVDLRDFAALQACFGDAGSPACAAGNVTGADGAIDLADVAEFVTRLSGV